MSHCSSVPYTTPQSFRQFCLPLHPSAPTIGPHHIQSSTFPGPLLMPPLALPIPLTPPQALTGPHRFSASSLAYSISPQVLSVTLWPLRPHLRPLPAPAVLSAPARRPNSPIRCSPSPGRQSAFAAVIPILPSASLPHSRPDTHYSLSSTMSLRDSATASCQPGLPPASRWPLSRWPGPAPLPVRLRRGLLCPRCSRCGRRAGFCRPALASPPPAPLPTPPGAPVPQRRAGAGRLCGNQSVRRSSAR